MIQYIIKIFYNEFTIYLIFIGCILVLYLKKYLYKTQLS